MSDGESISWEKLLEIDFDELGRSRHQRISVNKSDLEGIIGDFSKLVYATERRYHDTADRLIYEHRERFRQDLISMNNIRLRLDALLRSAR